MSEPIPEVYSVVTSYYSVEPFSGSHYNKNAERYSGDDACLCAICGKPVKDPYRHIGVVVDGGAAWATDAHQATFHTPGMMGDHVIGPDCHKRHVLGSFEVERRAG